MRVLNLALAAAFAVSVGGNFLLRHDWSRPNADFLPEMVYAVAYDSFTPNPNFPDGKTLQKPVEGTVARRVPVRAVNENAALARGAKVYQSFCAVCHGGAGQGDGAVVMRGYPAPPPLMGKTALEMTDRQMFDLLTAGRKNMPAYAAQISPEDRWKAIRHVRSMQKGAAK